MNPEHLLDEDPQFQARPPIPDRLSALADALQNAPRCGTDRDDPEGTCYIMISDTLATQMAQELREMATLLHAPIFLAQNITVEQVSRLRQVWERAMHGLPSLIVSKPKSHDT